MSTLRQVQHDFQACVLYRNNNFSGQIVSSVNAGAAERLEVYQQAYRLRLVEVLGNDFPGLKGLAGEQKFRELAENYITAQPSTSRSVRHLGAHLAAFIHNSQPGEASEAWGEMAEFEWLKNAAFDAANAPAANIADLAGLRAEDWPHMHLSFQPSLMRIDLGCNTAQRWRALADEQPLPDAEVLRPRQPWLIWRASLEVHWRPLERDEALVLDAMRNGSGFATICGVLDDELGDESQAALRAVILLKRWLEEGLVSTLQA